MVGMPKSIQRGFIVGDRHFLTYDEARQFASDNKVMLQRKELEAFISNILSDESAEEVAMALLARYEIKPRKTRTT